MPIGDVLSPEIERIGKEIVDAAYKVHRSFGPGLLESAYEVCLFHELTKRGLKVRRQVAVPIVYDGVALETGYRIDLLVEELVIVECKAIDRPKALNEAQLLTHLRLANKQLGFLINFNVQYFKDATQRMVI